MGLARQSRFHQLVRRPKTSSPWMGEDRGEGERGPVQEDHPPPNPSHQGRGVWNGGGEHNSAGVKSSVTGCETG